MRKKSTDFVKFGELYHVLRQRESSFYYCWFCLWIIFILFILFAFTILIAFTNPSKIKKSNHHIDNNGEEEATQFIHFKIDENLKWIEDNLLYIGKRYDWQKRKTVEGYVCLTYNREVPTSEIEEEKKLKKKSHGSEPCSNPFGSGARWKTNENFVIDAKNNQGLSKEYFFDMNWISMCEWDSKLTFNIFGKLDNTSIADGPDTNMPDGKNEIQFGIIDEGGVIALTIIWGIFNGPIQEREIVEADILYNLLFEWGNASIDPNVIDGQNIAVHELGHYIGFGHVSNRDATMFPSASLGETKKRSLLDCEIEGLCIHYGESGTCPGHNSTGTIPPRFKNSTKKNLDISFLKIYFLVFLLIIIT